MPVAQPWSEMEGSSMGTTIVSILCVARSMSVKVPERGSLSAVSGAGEEDLGVRGRGVRE